jgi:lipopolysaccharide transport system ATP-binding protein
MSQTVISVENLSKSYLIGHRNRPKGRSRYTALRDVIGREISGFARRAVDVVRGRQVLQGDETEEFWALRDVSFEVKAGEVVGIIGSNGAGKSTLLKILSRITEPTRGRITLRGRVASLLEVGTGFHPELTGRENIFLNGAILGMTRREIQRKFDEIVAFAEVDRFLDTPVKRFSSGMYVRLAFAVAAHLDPEILIVDEVLAVGDAEFQKKCLGRIGDASRYDGRTVLFVSHNLAAVAELTDRALLLNSGSLVADGRVADVVSSYLSLGSGDATYVRPQGGPTDFPHIVRAELATSDPCGVHQFGAPLKVTFWIRHVIPMRQACISFQILNHYNQPIIHAFAYHPEFVFGKDSKRSIVTCVFPELRLNVGHFSLRIFLSEPPGGEIYEQLDGICNFEMIRSDRAVLWGWRPEVCAYHEQCLWRCTTGTSDVEQ